MEVTELNGLIREWLDKADSGMADPRDVADAVLLEIPAREYRSVLEIVFYRYVGQIARGQRRESYGRRYEYSEAELEAMERRVDRRTAVAQAEREWISELCAQRVCVKGEWMFLGDCTSDDLLSLARDHETLAAENEDRAEFYRGLQRKLKRRRAGVVSELGASDLSQFEAQAA